VDTGVMQTLGKIRAIATGQIPYPNSPGDAAGFVDLLRAIRDRAEAR
jgi:hypothetical protein